MRNLEAIISQLASEQQRCSHLLLDDINAIKKACTLFFDKQQREADSFMAMLAASFDDIAVKVQNGYPREQKPADETDPLPAIVTGRKLTDEERNEILKAVGDAA